MAIPACAFFSIVATLLMPICKCKPMWDIGTTAEGIFFMHLVETRQSVEQRDDLVIWIGPAASGPRVHGKKGEMALPSAWAPYVDVLFVNLDGIKVESIFKGECNGEVAKIFWEFVSSRYSSYKTLYFAGVFDDGGSCLPMISTQKPVSHIQTIGGTMLLDPPFTPTAKFVTHGSLQSGNGELKYAANRAAQNVVCNARLSAVSLIMDDVELRYVPRAHSTIKGSEHEDYVLDNVRMPGMGCYSPDDFLQAMSTKSSAEENIQFGPFLPDRLVDGNGVESCPSKAAHDSDHLTNDFLQKSVGRVVLLRTLKHNFKLTCSFYIGIFLSEGVWFRRDVNDGDLNEVNRASLEEAWPWGDSYPIGEIQESSDNGGHPRKVTWAHINTDAPLTRRGSLMILSLLKGDINELDFFSEP